MAKTAESNKFMRYEYKTAVLQNVFQPMIKEISTGTIGKGRREVDEKKATDAFMKLMKKISDDGWRIISVNEIAGVIFYTLEKEIK